MVFLWFDKMFHCYPSMSGRPPMYGQPHTLMAIAEPNTRWRNSHLYICVYIYIYTSVIHNHQPLLYWRFPILKLPPPPCAVLLVFAKGSLEVKLPTMWTNVKQRWEESKRRREAGRGSERRNSEEKEDAGARKGTGVALHCVFPRVCGSGGSKSRLAKAADAEPSGQMRHEKLHAVVARKKNQVKMYKTHQVRTTFGSWHVEKVHAVVARSTFPSQKCKKVTVLDHFWKLRCRKSVRRCGAKHISKSSVLKKIRGSDHFLDVQISFRVAGAGDCAPCQKWANREGFCNSFNYNHQYTTLHLHYATLHSTPPQYTTLHCTTLRYATLHYTPPRYTPLHSIPFHYTTLHSITPLHSTTLHCTTLHYTALHYTTPHYTSLQPSLQLQIQLHHNYTTTTLHTTTATTTSTTTTTSSTAQGGGGSFRIGNLQYRRGWWLWITDGRAKPLIDRRVVGVVFVGVVAMAVVVTSPTTAGCSVVYCNCSRSCSVVEL